MNKISGNKSDFSLLTEDRSRIIIGYGLTELEDNMCEWYEVYIPKKEKSFITFNDVENAIISDINLQTDEKILTGYVWTLLHGWKNGDNGEIIDLARQDVNVWLSNENQNNFSEAHNVAKNPPEGFLPVTFKVGEDADKRAIYEKFYTFEEIDAFYLGGAAFKNTTLNEGWARKDAIDWSPYKALFPENG